MTAPDPRLDKIHAIPAEAVEAAAKMIVRTIDSRSWDSLLPSSHEWYRDRAHAALEAAHPALLAELRKAHEALERVEAITSEMDETAALRSVNAETKSYYGTRIRAAVAAAKGDGDKPFTGFPPTPLRKNKVG